MGAYELQDLPLLAPWTGPHGGVPPFDQVKVADFKPAFEAAMSQQMAELERITGNPAPPSFDNTIAALERAGRALNRVSAVFGVWASTMSSAEFQVVERDMQPKLAAFADKIYQNTALFARIEAIYADSAGVVSADLTPVQKRLVWHYHNQFVRAGAKLDLRAKARVAAINERWPHCLQASARICSPTKPIMCSCCTKRRSLRVCPRRCVAPRARQRSRSGCRMRGPSQHTLVDGSVPDLRRAPRSS